jgi:peptidoglycan/xylan/chitin deacetylase (PgdA/CDA1 family)
VRAEREVLSRVGRRDGTQRARILCYHGVGTPAWGVNDLDPRRFREQIELSLSAGYRFVAADAAVTAREPKTLAITFDDGLASVVTGAAPILREYGIPFTVFVVADWADGRHPFAPGTFSGWAELDALTRSGASIGSHSMTHANFARITATQTEFELGESRRSIEARLGMKASMFAIPFGCARDWTPASAAAAVAAGYTSVFAQSEDARPADTIGRTFVTRCDDRDIFRAALGGAFDRWEEWV